MKMLTTFLLLCAGTALTNAAAVPEAEPDLMKELEVHMEQDDGVVFSGDCPAGWERYNDRCFFFSGAAKPWAFAERNCRAFGGNIASIHSYEEENFIQGLIHRTANGYPATWIGGSDAQYEGLWLWSDSSSFNFTNWCRTQPDNLDGQEHCHVLNLGGPGCWHDLSCHYYRAYVCAKKV